MCRSAGSSTFHGKYRSIDRPRWCSLIMSCRAHDVKKILLLQAQLLTLNFFVIWIKDFGNVLSEGFAGNRTLVVAAVEAIKIERLCRFRLPQPQVVSYARAISENRRRVVRTALYNRRGNPAHLIFPVSHPSSFRCGSTKTHLHCYVRTGESPRDFHAGASDLSAPLASHREFAAGRYRTHSAFHIPEPELRAWPKSPDNRLPSGPDRHCQDQVRAPAQRSGGNRRPSSATAWRTGSSIWRLRRLFARCGPSKKFGRQVTHNPHIPAAYSSPL